MSTIAFTGVVMVLALSQCQPSGQSSEQPSAAPAEAAASDVIFEEVDGAVAVEAEHFTHQADTLMRKWYAIDEVAASLPAPDPDGNHAAEASGGVYLEALPDTRTTHDDSLIVGENFFPEPGKAGVLSYPVYFNNPGKYYVWVRTHTSGTEDNGIHVGLNGEWPDTGQRMQFGGNRQTWFWDSRQRTEEVHTGVPELIYLMIEKPGLHTIHFSIREDGFEFDKWVMTTEYQAPKGMGPQERRKNNTDAQ